MIQSLRGFQYSWKKELPINREKIILISYFSKLSKCHLRPFRSKPIQLSLKTPLYRHFEWKSMLQNTGAIILCLCKHQKAKIISVTMLGASFCLHISASFPNQNTTEPNLEDCTGISLWWYVIESSANTWNGYVTHSTWYWYKWHDLNIVVELVGHQSLSRNNAP